MLNSRRVNNYQNDGFGNYYQNISFHLYVKKIINDNNEKNNNDSVLFVRSNLSNCNDVDIISPLIVTNSNNNQGNNSINNKVPDSNNSYSGNNSNNDDNGKSNNFNRLNQVTSLPLISTTKTRQYFSDLRPFSDLISFNSIFIEITKAFIGVVNPLGWYES